MIVKPGYIIEKKDLYTYKPDGTVFTHIILAKWYAVALWKKQMGYLQSIEYIFQKEVFPFTFKERDYEFSPQFKIYYNLNQMPEYQIYSKYNAWYYNAFRKGVRKKYKYADVRFLEKNEIEISIKRMKVILDYDELIEIKENEWWTKNQQKE